MESGKCTKRNSKSDAGFEGGSIEGNTIPSNGNSQISRDQYARVTEILRPFSGVEFVPVDILEKSGSKGTKVHEYIEQYLNGFMISLDDIEIVHYLDSFDFFCKEFHVDLLKSTLILEKRFYDDELMITGQIDCIVPTPSGHILLDWKTSSKESASWPLQAAAYIHLAKLEGIDISACYFIKLNKYGDFPEVYEYRINYDRYIKLFMNCIDLYKHFDMKNRGWK